MSTFELKLASYRNQYLFMSNFYKKIEGAYSLHSVDILFDKYHTVAINDTSGHTIINHDFSGLLNTDDDETNAYLHMIAPPLIAPPTDINNTHFALIFAP